MTSITHGYKTRNSHALPTYKLVLVLDSTACQNSIYIIQFTATGFKLGL